MRAWGLAIAVLLLAASPAAAQRVAFKHVANATDWGAADGSRYAVFPTAKKSEIVFDARGRKLKTRRIPLVRCDDGQLPFDYLAGGGQLVAQCSYALLIQNLASGQFAAPPYVERPGGFFDYAPDGSEGFEVFATALGANWIGATVSTDTAYVKRYLEWHTGESADAPASASEVADPGSAGLVRRLCSPLERVAEGFGRGGGFYPYIYRGGIGVTTGLSGARGRNGAQGEDVTIQRCGDSTPTVIGRCSGWCFDVQLGGGVITWESAAYWSSYPGDGSVYAYSIAHHRLYHWRGHSFAGKQAKALIGHTGKRLFVTACTGAWPKRDCKVLTALLGR